MWKGVPYCLYSHKGKCYQYGTEQKEGLISSTQRCGISVYNTLSIPKNQTHMVWWWKSWTEFSETGLELLKYILPEKKKKTKVPWKEGM